jgi:hypothetical protein
VEEFPLQVKISQNLLQSSSIHLNPPFPKQALSVSIVSSGAFLVDVCCCPGHIRGRRRSPGEASWCQFRKQVWGTKGIEQSQVVEGWPRMRKTIRSCGCGCGRDRLQRRGWRRGRRWVRAFGVGPSVMDRWSMGKLRNLGQRSRVARARG